MSSHRDTGDIEKLLDIMAALRDPHTGCLWDLQQTFATIAPYTVEEAYEVADAIERNAIDELAVELGDLLLQVVFHSRLGEEAGAFTFADVTRHICDKMIRRHPHVFAAGADCSADPVAQGAPGSVAPSAADPAAGHPEAWEAAKRREKGPEDALLDGVTRGLPATTRAAKLGRRAATVGFDWPDARGPRDKIDEELAELDEALESGGRERVEAELGDVLFAVAQLARHLGVDPEQCARGANRRFEARFRHVESLVEASGRSFAEHSPEELDAYWRRAKTATD